MAKKQQPNLGYYKSLKTLCRPFISFSKSPKNQWINLLLTRQGYNETIEDRCGTKGK